MSENITTLIGVLLDVSRSMESSVGDGVRVEGGEWVRSIFHVIDDLVNHDVSEKNEVFAIGFGASGKSKEIFDIFSTLKRFREKKENTQYTSSTSCFSTHDRVRTASMRQPWTTRTQIDKGPSGERYTKSFTQTVNRILDILEDAGALAVRKWAVMNVIQKAMSHNMAIVMMRGLENDDDFVKSVVDHCLPSACKGFAPDALRGENQGLLSLMASPLISAAESVASTVRPATEDDIKDVVGKAKDFLLNDVNIRSSIISVKEASNIIHGSVDEEKLTENRLKELMEVVRPFIYGGTPLFTSLEKANELFSGARYHNHKKLLFVLSDGEPTDTVNMDILRKLGNNNVVIVSCFITRSVAVEPQKLYSQCGWDWDKGAIFMFDISSKVPTNLLPRAIFIKRGWKIDINNNETKLFLHVNHPENIKDACNLARNVVCCQEALADILVSVSLDIYINQSTTGFGAPLQVGGTCYANASATVLHLSMKRILGREGDHPDFTELRKELIDRYGIEGANTLEVLQHVCPKYRLHCKEVDILGAMRAIVAKRPVVARFRLTNVEWQAFRKFYEDHSTGVLTRNEIDLRKDRHGVQSGHAVVLTSFNSECLYLMNSWGTRWGDNGFFRVQNADVLELKFIDVFWTEYDLTLKEKDYYRRHGSEVADKLVNSLISLQRAEYQCPLCHRKSLVTEFSGHLTEAQCPKCRRYFNSNDEGNILALNMYLTSISR